LTALDVLVRPALAGEQRLIEGLIQFYIYDWSEMERPDSDAFEVEANGQFEAYPDLGDYWSKAEHWPLVIAIGERVAGFALLNTHSHLSGGHIERNMAEFFVARKHRRRGVAAEALRQILHLHPGQWEVAIAERNMAAKAFWPKAIEDAPNVSGLYLTQGDGDHWRGPIWCFRAA
jgi:predicted acetyltransferase